MNSITLSNDLNAICNIIECDLDLNQRIGKRFIKKYKPKKNHREAKPIKIHNVGDVS